MRRMRCIFLTLIMALAFIPQKAGASLWVECMFAASVNDISAISAEPTPQITLKLDVKIVTVRRGTNNNAGCGFRKGDTIEIKNYSDSPDQRRTFISKASSDISNLKSGDHVTVLYGLLDNEKGKQEIWEFLRIKRIGK